MIRSRPYKSRKQNREISGSLQGLPRKGTPTDTTLDLAIAHATERDFVPAPDILILVPCEVSELWEAFFFKGKA